MTNKRFGQRVLLDAVALCAAILGLLTHVHRRGQQSGYEYGFDAAMSHRLSERNLLTSEYPIDDSIAKGFPV